MYAHLGHNTADRSRRRRGIIAFTALIMLSVMVVVTAAASQEMALETRASQNRNSVRQAYYCAWTGIDYCLYLSQLYSDWRTRLGAGNWISDFSVGTGTVTVTATDPDDGTVSGDPIGKISFTAAAACGLARRNVVAQAQPPPGPTLKYVLCSTSNKNLELKKGVSVYGDVRTSGIVNADSDVKLVGNIYTSPSAAVTAALVDADTQVIRTEQTVDPPSIDFTWYRSVAQELTLSLSGGRYEISKALLTPSSNPYGLTSPQGLYYIDGKGAEVRIGECYIVGTLIIANASKVVVRVACFIRPAAKKYPAIISNSDIEIQIERILKESAAGKDFNGDGDTNDQYVSQINGVIYSTKRVTGFQTGTDAGPFYINGAIVADEIKVSDAPAFHVCYDPDLAQTAVAGFQGPGLVLVPGTIRD